MAGDHERIAFITMFRKHFDDGVLTDPSWWHWALTVPLLALYLAGSSRAGQVAMLLCAVAAGYFLLRLKRLRPYPVQVRLAYLGLLMSGMLAGMQWILWLSLVGTTAMVTVGYCPLLRLLSLAPWNRNAPLRWSHVWQVFVREPCAGGIVRWHSSWPAPALSCCAPPLGGTLNSCSIATRPVASLSAQETTRAHVH